MDLMARYPDKYFDLAIVDPPYGNNTKVEQGSTSWGRKYIPRGKKWDTPPGADYFSELMRVSKHQIIFGAQFFNGMLPARRGWVCWYKSDMASGRTFSDFELAWTSWDISARHFTCPPFIKAVERIHPTQKPTQLYAWLLMNYAQHGWKILDTHMGSGSLAIACYNLGFSLTACEIDGNYFAATVERLRLFSKQGRLFK
jgi:site-specific DNA-methyltransferase (adenine-specific)